MSTNCAGRHQCEPDFYPMSLDARWSCPECKREHVPFRVEDDPNLPESIRSHLLPGYLGWRTATLVPE